MFFQFYDMLFRILIIYHFFIFAFFIFVIPFIICATANVGRPDRKLVLAMKLRLGRSHLASARASGHRHRDNQVNLYFT